MGSLIYFTIGCLQILVTNGEPVSVNLESGQVRGVWNPDQSVAMFLGVPYASAPVGDLRFKAPIKPNVLKVDLDCSVLKPLCPRVVKEGEQAEDNTLFDEDCLFLNIYLPGKPENQQWPVLVYFLGDNIGSNSLGQVDGVKLTRNAQIVVVTVSYRLGVLGFYGKSNVGLLDQVHALRFVKRNIEKFGGDSKKVTIVGSGFEANAVGLHVVSPLSNGLFQRAVSHITSPMLIRNQDKLNEDFAQALNCKSANNMSCMRMVPLNRLLEMQHQFAVRNKEFSFSIDGEFLPMMPSEMFKLRISNSINHLIGFSVDSVSSSLPKISSQEGVNADDVIGKFSSKLSSCKHAEATLYKLIQFEYDMNGDILSPGYEKNIPEFRASLHRDAISGGARLIQILNAQTGSKVFAYFIDKIVQNGIFQRTGTVEDRCLFGIDTGSYCDRLFNAWTFFVRTGLPSEDWPSFNETTKHFVQIAEDGSVETRNMYPDNISKRIKFWSEPIPEVLDMYANCDRLDSDVEDGPVVSLREGKVMGTTVTLEDNYTFDLFIGIPYAAPPVGQLRWQPPQKHESWSDVFKLPTKRVACPQMYLYPQFPVYDDQVEDCLNLDIYVPHNVNQSEGKLPVMIFIHGGGFTIGSKNEYSGAALIQYGVIYVQLNYRLGVLGFMSTGDKYARGNFGLSDQQFAIRWVKDNIASFGGDPNLITIFGESAGAGSVSMQMLSPSNKGLFKRGIAQSGNSMWFLFQSKEVAETNINYLAQRLNCSNSSSYTTVECLRQIDAITLSTIDQTMNMGNMLEHPFVPIIGDDFLPKSPATLYEEGHAKDVEYITGINRDESFSFYAIPSYQDMFLPPFLDNSSLVAPMFKYVYADLLNSNGTMKAEPEHETGVKDFFTDVFIAASSDRDAKYHARFGGNTYRYLFNFRPAKYAASEAPSDMGGDHGDDMMYMFGSPVMKLENAADFLHNDLKWPDADVALSNAMMAHWTNFAQTGNPNKGRTSFSYNWPSYTLDSKMVLELSSKLKTASGDEAVINPERNPEHFRERSWNVLNNIFPTLFAESARLKACTSAPSVVDPISDCETAKDLQTP